MISVLLFSFFFFIWENHCDDLAWLSEKHIIWQDITKMSLAHCASSNHDFYRGGPESLVEMVADISKGSKWWD